MEKDDAQLVVYTGARVFVDGTRIVEGIDWVCFEGEPSQMLLNIKACPLNKQRHRVVIEQPGQHDRVFNVKGAKPFLDQEDTPWRGLELKELMVQDELRAAATSLPK